MSCSNVIGKVSKEYGSFADIIVRDLKEKFGCPDYRFVVRESRRKCHGGAGWADEVEVVLDTNFVPPKELIEKMRAACPQVVSPGPEATTWENDYRLSRYWLTRALEVWDAVPVEFRGDPQNPHTLVEKVQLMIREIDKLRASR